MAHVPLREEILSVFLLAFLFFLGCGSGNSQAGNVSPEEGPKSIILFIGDGMGLEQVRAGGMYAKGSEGSLAFEAFPYKGSVATGSADSAVTDSAASATAMATGIKVGNGVISTAIPGGGGPLETILEHFKARRKATGLVTTSFVSHATPAAFGAHEPSRDNYPQIAADYLQDSRPEVLFGGAKYITEQMALDAGYLVVNDRAEMQALDTEAVDRVSGQFGTDHMPYEYSGPGALPHLSEMTETALNILDNDPDGFFLMVEGARIDHAGHINDIGRAVSEVAEFGRAVEAALRWSSSNPDTLILVTADHETGGLSVFAAAGIGNAPSVNWSTTGHTATNVPVYGTGQNAARIANVSDNTGIYSIMRH
jgi:alkaline phosphatase